MTRRIGVILFENFTLLGMCSKTDTENWLMTNKVRILKVFRKFNQVTVFTDQDKLARCTSNTLETTVDEVIAYLHSSESSKLYKGKS